MPPASTKSREKNDSGAKIGFEAEMWKAADSLRGRLTAVMAVLSKTSLKFADYRRLRSATRFKIPDAPFYDSIPSSGVIAAPLQRSENRIQMLNQAAHDVLTFSIKCK